MIKDDKKAGAIISGDFMRSVSDDYLLCIINSYSELVFARTTPD